MADVEVDVASGQPMRRTFWMFSFGGVDLDALLDMGTDDLIKIFHARAHRRREKPGHSPLFGYDFWYQPRHKTMISSSWGAPAPFSKGFDLQHVADGLHGRHLYVYSWPEGELSRQWTLETQGLYP